MSTSSTTSRSSAVKTVVIVTAVALLLVVAWQTLKPTGSGYVAEFTHASGVRLGDDVRVAGIPSGEVTGIELDGDVARVEFDLDDDVTLHTDSEARVKLASMLGQTYLEVTAGSGQELEPGATLGTDRTAPSYTVSNVITDGTDIAQQLDLDAIDQAISTLSTELDQDPEMLERTIAGTTELATMIGEKDEQIDRLLSYTREVTGVVRNQQDQLESLLVNAETVTSLVQRRRDTLERIIGKGREVVTTLNQMADRNDETMRTLLEQFDQTLAVLDEHREELGTTLERSAPFARYFANATGNGPWLEVGAPYFVLPDNLICLLVPADKTGGCE